MRLSLNTLRWGVLCTVAKQNKEQVVHLRKEHQRHESWVGATECVADSKEGCLEQSELSTGKNWAR